MNTLFDCAYEEAYELIKLGADVNEKNSRQRTPLHEAAKASRARVVKALLEAGAEVDARDADGWTPLPLAVWSPEIMEMLLDAGADVNAEFNDGWTPVFVAASCDCIEAFEIFMNHGADPKRKTPLGWTPLHLAADNGNLEMARTLIEAGVDINSKSLHGTTPLHLAAFSGRHLMVQELIKFGADVLARDENGNTPITMTRNEYVVNELIKAGALSPSKNESAIDFIFQAGKLKEPVYDILY